MSAPTPLETVLLETTSSRAFVAPTRGALLTRFIVSERPVLYLDETTLLDPTKNVRGGNPVLFPSPGRLEGDVWARDGRAGSMGQHGFARNQAWTIEAQSTDEVTLRLRANDATRAVFPWEFETTLRYALRGTTLRIEQRIASKGGALPFGAGFHPYFFVPDGDKCEVRIPTSATRAWSNVERREVALDGPRPLDLTKPEVDLRLYDHGGTEASLLFPDDRAIHLRASRAFRHWIIWTLAGRDFVCLEPWTSPPNALNTGADLLVAEPDADVTLWVEIDAAV